MKWGLILAGIAAVAAYKYSKMSESQKKSMINNLKGKGKKVYDKYMPDNLKDMMAKA